MNDPQIVFQDIENPTLRTQVKDLMDDLMQVLPSDSTVLANFRYIHDRFLGEVKVASQTVLMQVCENASAISELLEDVRTKLMTQIVDWRAHRFAS